MPESTPHALPVSQALEHLASQLHQGLTTAEARARLERYGPNELQEKPRPGFFKLLLDQFNNFLVIILIVAAIVSLLLGEVYRRSGHPRDRHLERGAWRRAGVQGRTGTGSAQEDGCAERPGDSRRQAGDDPGSRVGPRGYCAARGGQLCACRPAPRREHQPEGRRSLADRRVCSRSTRTLAWSSIPISLSATARTLPL